jgi:alpha-glucosidase
MKHLQYFLIALSALCIAACRNTSGSVQSPNGRISVTVTTEGGKLFYTLQRDHKTVLDKSLLGFRLKDSELFENFRITDIRHTAFDEKWAPVWGEETTIDNNYNEMKIAVEETTGLRRTFTVVFRLFDDGCGFRYEFPEQPHLKDLIVTDELTEFAFTGNHKTWSIPFETTYYEALYKSASLNTIGWVSTPLTMETADGLYLTLHEANLTDYAAMNAVPKAGTTTMKASLTPLSTGESAFATLPFVTPWRTLIIADNAGDLLLSRLMLNLNEPNRIEDTSWIAPGRYIGIWWDMHMKTKTWEQGPDHGATTENTKRYIDFAAAHGFSGVLVEGWNIGWGGWTGYSYTEPYDDFDIEEITRYGAERGVRLIGHHETGGEVKNYERQLEDGFAFYRKHGVNAVKTGYVLFKLDSAEYHSSQYGVRHFRHVIETAAKHRIMIDNHEPVMPTGLQRTYPNLMTQEGVRGQEWDAWSSDGGNPPEHTTIIPFTRGLAGPIDFTPVTFKFENPVMPGTRVQTTLAKQLALFVVLFSPLQMASDMIEHYESNPAPFKFIETCPTTWSKTVVPHAKIGEYLTIARKATDSDNWYIGSITNAESRILSLSFDFLDKGADYRATIYRDGVDADWKTNPYSIEITEQTVNADTVLTLDLAPGGGTAIELIKL